MRFYGLALVAGAFVLGACGGGDKGAADTAAAKTDSATTASTPPVTPPAAPAGAAAPITGQTVEVKMIGDNNGYHFEPSNITIKSGDGIKFVNTSGGPHNVAFDGATLPPDVKAQLLANMPEQQGELSGKILTQPNEAYVVSFGNIKPGKYEVHCTPHLAMNMKATITVQ